MNRKTNLMSKKNTKCTKKLSNE